MNILIKLNKYQYKMVNLHCWFYIILKIGLLFNAKQEALSSGDNNY